MGMDIPTNGTNRANESADGFGNFHPPILARLVLQRPEIPAISGDQSGAIDDLNRLPWQVFGQRSD